MLSHFSHVRLLATPWTAAHQAPLSVGFSRKEYSSGVPLPSPVLLAGNGHFLARVQPRWIQGYSKVGTESASLEITYLITDREGLEN